MTKKSLPKWDKERESILIDMVGTDATMEVSATTVEQAAETLETTTRSIGSKLRKMGYEVQSSIKAVKKAFTEEQEDILLQILDSNPGVYTFAEISEMIFATTDKARQVQGKILSMELTNKVKKTEPKEEAKKYTEEEEVKIVDMINNGAYLEDIAEALGKEIKSIRGKTLSMIKSHNIVIPKQRTSHAKTGGDALEALGDVSKIAIEDIAKSIGKTVRGVKTMLTFRGISCSDYDGAKKAKKIAEKKVVA